MTYAIEAIFDEASRMLAREDRRLQALEQARPHLIQDQFDNDGVAAMSRALTFVVCAGILEQLMRDLPVGLSSDLCALGVTRRDLPVGLLSVLEASQFRRCSDASVLSFSVRASLVRSIVDHVNDSRIVADFGNDLKLADGRTITSKNFEALWEILDLPDAWRNDPNDVWLLNEIHDKRNSIAHWEQDPVAVGRMKSPNQLRSVTNSLSLLLDHVNLHLCDWLDGFAVKAAASP